ncbi:lipoprotein, partial [Streptomyces rubiginosohelvolus]
GPVVVHLGGLDSDEHTAMRPAFELAKKRKISTVCATFT